MMIQSLAFTRTAETPEPPARGAAIALSRQRREAEASEPAREVVAVHGACRAPRTTFPENRLDLLRALFLVAVDAPSQRPAAWRLVDAAKTLLYEDDVLEAGGSWVAGFRFELDEAILAGGPLLLHVSLLGRVSNVLWV